jgi:hypothetical protein
VTHTPNVGQACNDNNLCTSGETCQADASCGGGSAVSTDDGDNCTQDSCDPSTGVHHDSIPGCPGGCVSAPPVVAPPTSSPTGPVAKGSPVTISATFTDADDSSGHTCTIDWDDGTTGSGANGTDGNVTEPSGSTPGSCSKSHTYANAGVYTVTVTVRDTCASGSNVYQYVVIYDPNAGFVTGGGWINQPSDGFPALVGRANFGFVSKYKKGSNVPDGETEFQFKAGAINFHSTAYDAGSLVISGGRKATYRGSGTVNGVSGYRFLLVAYDGNAPGGDGIDRFRIKITQGNTIIYDNRPLASEDVDLADPTALGGGSIVIHK